MGSGHHATANLSPTGDSRAGEVLRLRREISRMQRRRSEYPRLPLDPAFSSLLPEQGFLTGATYCVSPSPSLVLALLSAASQKGHWCAAVGMPTLGIEAAATFGVVLSRLILVPEPGERWLTVTSALAEVVPLIAVAPIGQVHDASASRLNARLRDRGTTLLIAETTGPRTWPQSEGTIRLHDQQWYVAGNGWGLLEGSTATVTAQTRNSPLPSSVRVRLPGSHGAVEAVAPETKGVAPVAEMTALRIRHDDFSPDPQHDELAVAG